MSIFGKYTGARINPVPSGFLESATQQAKMTADAYGSLGDSIGDALKSYSKRKEESETLEGLIYGATQKALELNKFLDGDEPISGKGIGPEGQDVTYTPDKATISGALPGAPSRVEEGQAAGVMADALGLKAPSPLSQKTDLLYEIAGDQKLVDKFLSGDATLAQKKGLLANLQMYNSKLDDYSKRAAIEEHRYKLGQRDAWTKSYGAGQNLQPTQIPARTVEDTTTTELATKEQMDRLRHLQETGIDPVTGRDAVGYDDARFSPEEFDKLERYWAGDPSEVPQQQPPDLSNFDPVAAERSIAELPEAEATELAKKLDYYNAKVKPMHDSRLATHAARTKEINSVIDKMGAKKAEYDSRLAAFRNKPETKKLQGLIDTANEHLNDPKSKLSPSNVRNFNIIKDANQKKLDALKKKEGVLAPLDYDRGLKEMSGKLARQYNTEPKLQDSIAAASREDAGYSIPEGGYATGPLVETETTTREIPAETIPAEPVDRKAAHMKAFIEQGGQMTPESLATFDKLYPEAGIISQPVPGVPGATALFDTKGKFLQVVAPPTLTVTERAAVNAITFTPNTGFTGMAPTSAEAVAFRDQISDATKAKSRANFLIDAAKKGKLDRVWWDEHKGQVQTAAGFLRASLRKEIAGPGAVSEYEQKLLQEVAADPSKLTSLSDLDLGRLSRIIIEVDKSLESKAKVLGLTPVGTQPGQAGGAPTRRAYTGTKFEDR